MMYITVKIKRKDRYNLFKDLYIIKSKRLGRSLISLKGLKIKISWMTEYLGNKVFTTKLSRKKKKEYKLKFKKKLIKKGILDYIQKK